MRGGEGNGGTVGESGVRQGGEAEDKGPGMEKTQLLHNTMITHVPSCAYKLNNAPCAKHFSV